VATTEVPSADALYRVEDLKLLPMPDTLFGLLDAIRERPGWYVGRKSLCHLYTWLCGLRFARWQLKAPPLPGEGEFAGFDWFLCEKYRRHDTVGWAAKIAYYHQDDADAFDEFFRLLDEYRRGLATAISPDA
jgi:hypothetical protein